MKRNPRKDSAEITRREQHCDAGIAHSPSIEPHSDAVCHNSAEYRLMRKGSLQLEVFPLDSPGAPELAEPCAEYQLDISALIDIGRLTYDESRVIHHRFVNDSPLEDLHKWMGYKTGGKRRERYSNREARLLLDSALSKLRSATDRILAALNGEVKIERRKPYHKDRALSAMIERRKQSEYPQKLTSYLLFEERLGDHPVRSLQFLAGDWPLYAHSSKANRALLRS